MIGFLRGLLSKTVVEHEPQTVRSAAVADRAECAIQDLPPVPRRSAEVEAVLRALRSRGKLALSRESVLELIRTNDPHGVAQPIGSTEQFERRIVWEALLAGFPLKNHPDPARRRGRRRLRPNTLVQRLEKLDHLQRVGGERPVSKLSLRDLDRVRGKSRSESAINSALLWLRRACSDLAIEPPLRSLAYQRYRVIRHIAMPTGAELADALVKICASSDVRAPVALVVLLATVARESEIADVAIRHIRLVRLEEGGWRLVLPLAQTKTAPTGAERVATVPKWLVGLMPAAVEYLTRQQPDIKLVDLLRQYGGLRPRRRRSSASEERVTTGAIFRRVERGDQCQVSAVA
jgi:hypothetical protein